MFDAFTLIAKLTLDSDEYDKGLGDAKSGLSKLGDSLKTGLATAAKVGAAAVTAASGAVVALTKNAVDNYAEYEQLVGGVETLFGKSAKSVQLYAKEAYKTAGLSANEYMETVTSFSASLLQSLGGDTAKAAHVSNMAITDMADNANKMGTAMESIQAAYQGFAKQNYTMLDNLKLGYGGTKTEMERLLADATKLSGVEYDINSLNDVYEAIHVVQTELGITGTTAKEASETISGSVAATKSAWENFVTAMGEGNERKLDESFNALVASAETAFGNILPVAEKAIYGVVHMVEAVAPLISEKLPQLVNEVLPMVIEAGTTLVDGVVKALPEIIKALIDAAPTIIESLTTTLADLSPELVELGFLLIIALIKGITASLPKLMEKAPEIVKAIVDTIIENAPEMLLAAAELFVALLTGIGEWIKPLIEKGKEIVESIKSGFMEKVEDAKRWGQDLIQNFISGIKEKWEALKQTVSNVAQTVKDYLGFSEPKKGPLSNFHKYAPDMMELFAKGIRDNTDVVTSQISKSFDFGEPSMSYGNAMQNNYYGAADAFSSEAQPINITLTLDGETLARVMWDYNNRESQLRGGALV